MHRPWAHSGGAGAAICGAGVGGELVGAAVTAGAFVAGRCLVAGGVVLGGSLVAAEDRIVLVSGEAAPCPPTMVEQPTNAVAIAMRPIAADRARRTVVIVSPPT